MIQYRFRQYTALCMLLGLLLSSPVFALPPLQLYIEITPAGGVLELPPGRYAGPAVIDRAITIEGNGEVVIDGGGEGTVLTVRADGVQVSGLRIVNSGRSHNTVDAGILIEADDGLVENNIFENVLFGIHLQKANNTTLRANTISSLKRDISLRGDGVRMWYSNDNLIENNHFDRIRDIVVSNSADNRFLHNTIERSRVGMELIFSPGNEIAYNTVLNNDTGIVLIYSNELNIHHNRVAHMRKLTGSGISFKESADVLVRDNEVAHCNIGLLANSPLDPENRMTIEGNLFTYNVLGIYFYGEKGGHSIRDNHFENNFTDAMGSAPRTIRHNKWSGNVWGQYRGFDRDRDGTGDRSHDVYLFSEHIWAHSPMVRFFRGSPVMELLDLALRLAPFSRPSLEYSDPLPRMQQDVGTLAGNQLHLAR